MFKFCKVSFVRNNIEEIPHLITSNKQWNWYTQLKWSGVVTRETNHFLRVADNLGDQSIKQNFKLSIVRLSGNMSCKLRPACTLISFISIFCNKLKHSSETLSIEN